MKRLESAAHHRRRKPFYPSSLRAILRERPRRTLARVLGDYTIELPARRGCVALALGVLSKEEVAVRGRSGIGLVGITALLISTWIIGCVDSGPCPQASGGGDVPARQPSTADVYAGQGDPFSLGELAIKMFDVNRCDRGAPVALRIHAPETAGDYAVVVFQHGFMSRNDAYDDILTQLASHGFVVVAPQMYEPGIGPLFGNPTASAEAELAARVVEWLPGNLDDVTGVHTRTDRLAIAGHSRGGKVAWLAAVNDESQFSAIAGVDPVDGAGGPLGGQSRVVQGPFSFPFPSLVIGTELGGDCAPTGENHEQFYDASPSPAWHIITLGQGHGDMLDEPEAAAAAALCPSGPDRAGMRRLTAGLLVAFFRGALQGDASAYGYLSAPQAGGVAISVESK